MSISGTCPVLCRNMEVTKDGVIQGGGGERHIGKGAQDQDRALRKPNKKRVPRWDRAHGSGGIVGNGVDRSVVVPSPRPHSSAQQIQQVQMHADSPAVSVSGGE